jgi:uncharacterized membrane protein YdbT with pleckstrin-like domain
VGYVDRHLQPGESVVYRTTVHWVVYMPAMLFLLAAVAVAIWFPVTDSAFVKAKPILIAILFGLSVLDWLRAFLRRLATELAVTDRRIVIKTGLIRRTTMEMNRSKVESVAVHQGIMGRLFDYGTVVVKGTGGGMEPLATIEHPLDFRSEITAG